jgi:hypothetical protein
MITKNAGKNEQFLLNDIFGKEKGFSFTKDD